jgi:hypothetical protein
MDSHDFFHTDECSAEVYEAMEQYAEYRIKELLKETPNDTELGKLIREKYGS